MVVDVVLVDVLVEVVVVEVLVVSASQQTFGVKGQLVFEE